MIKTKNILSFIFIMIITMMIASQEKTLQNFYSYFQVMITFLCIILFLLIVKYQPSIKTKLKYLINKEYIVIIIFALMIVNAIAGYIIYDYSPVIGILYAIAFSIVGILEFFAIPLLFNKYKFIAHNFRLLIIYISFFASIVSILIFFNGGRMLTYTTINDRIYSIFWDPNFCAMIISCGFCLVLFEKNSIYRIVMLLCEGIAIYLTGSRGTMVSLIVSILIYLLFYSNLNINRKVIRVFGYMVIVCALVYYLYNSNFFRIYQGSNNRLEMWEFAIKQILSNPFFGHGYQSINAFLPLSGFSNASTHNSLIDFTFSYGIITVIIYIYLIVSILIEAKKHAVEVNHSYILCVLFSICNSMTITYSFGGVGVTSALYTIFLGIVNLENQKIKNRRNFE